jgi:hypothetical protein
MRKLIVIIAAIAVLAISSCTKDSASVASNSGSNGQGGSLARFTIVGNYLYTVDNENLAVFDISNASTPVYKQKVSIGFNIEAIFPMGNNLFIASNTAMYIYDISNPEQPTQQSYVEHLTGCDPIVANDSVAFLTVHGGNSCGSSINELFIYDITNITSPQLISSMPMTNPFGLGLKDSVLYVCDNGAGLKVINVKDPSNPVQINLLSGDNNVDVIPTANVLISMLTDGIAYYDISNPAIPTKMSEIKN